MSRSTTTEPRARLRRVPPSPGSKPDKTLCDTRHVTRNAQCKAKHIQSGASASTHAPHPHAHAAKRMWEVTVAHSLASLHKHGNRPPLLRMLAAAPRRALARRELSTRSRYRHATRIGMARGDGRTCCASAHMFTRRRRRAPPCLPHREQSRPGQLRKLGGSLLCTTWSSNATAD